jgi:hypothetical protein
MQLIFVPLVKEMTPTVVMIYANTMMQPQRTDLPRDLFFEWFFRDKYAEKIRTILSDRHK